MDIVTALDFDRDAAATFRLNFPETRFLQGDIAELDVSALREDMDGCAGHPVLFAGCAPCQPFSVQNRLRAEKQDERLNLLDHFARFIRHYLPDFVLVENVPGLQTESATRGPLQAFKTMLVEHGYRFEARIVKAQDYGVPQRRARLVLIASRHGEITLPEATHGAGTTSPHVTAWEAIKDLPPLKAGERHSNVRNHVCAGLAPITLKRLRATPEGGDRRDWPRELWLDCHKRVEESGVRKSVHMDVYGRLRKHQPAAGLTTRCTSISNGRYGHPEQDRALSVREAARLQTFPDGFEFHGPLSSASKQVGNAVPVLMARRFGEQLVRHADAHALLSPKHG